MKRGIFLRTLVIIGLIPTATAVLLLVESAKTPVVEHIKGGTYEGVLPGLGQVRFELYYDGPDADARLYQEGTGISGRVRLQTNSAGGFHAELLADHTFGTNGIMEFQSANHEKQLIGTIITPAKRTPQKISLIRVYEHGVIRRQSGQMLGRFGASADFVSQIPMLQSASAFSSELEKELVKETTAAAVTGKERNWRAVWNDLRRVGEPQNLRTEQRWQLRLLTSSVASFAVWNDPENEGACGEPFFWTGRNFYWKSGKLHEFKLADLFRDESAWEAGIRNLCFEQLMTKDLPGPAQDANGADVKSREFTLSPTGLQIYFNPYEISGGADGEFVIHIPYARLQKFFKTNGPATLLPVFASKR